MVSRYRYARRVQFAETDLAGMVHFSWYLRYVEEAEHAMWRSAGLTIHDPDAPYGFPRVAFSIDYRAPLHFEDEFEVDIRIEAMSEKTIRYAAALRRGDTIVATSTHTAVCVTRASDAMKAADIPGHIRERLTIDPEQA